MRPVRLGRRAVLRGAGGVALALPFLEAMRPARSRAADPTTPRRLVLWYTANGTVPSAWTPGPDFTLSPILQPLADHRPDLTVLSGVDMRSSGGDRKGHNRGVGCLWSGREPLGGNDGDAGYGDGITVDQHVAAVVGATTRFASLELGVEVKTSQPRGRMIYSGPNQPIPPEESPWKAFNRIFTGLGVDDPEAIKLRARRQTVLDAVQGEFKALNPRLGAADREKLDAHLTAIREIEGRLQAVDLPPAACAPPALPAPFDAKKNDNFPAIGQLQIDLLVMALACDLTRVASLMWSHALSGVIHTWLGHDLDHHSISHFGDVDSVERLIAINTWYAVRFAELIVRLKSIPEGDGTLFDSTVVVWGSELGKGQPHHCANIPFVLAGSCGGRLKTGQHLTFDGASHNDLLIALMQAMGVEGEVFGDPAFCSGPLPGLLA
ncbi:MAG: DUF1552 domain-containing protein [Nannocystaceae bacterium]